MEETLEQWLSRQRWRRWIQDSPPPAGRAISPRLKAYLRRLLKEFDRCAYCGVRLTVETATRDHIIPRSKGGDRAADNIVLACQPCNTRKADNEWTVRYGPRAAVNQELLGKE